MTFIIYLLTGGVFSYFLSSLLFGALVLSGLMSNATALTCMDVSAVIGGTIIAFAFTKES